MFEDENFRGARPHLSRRCFDLRMLVFTHSPRAMRDFSSLLFPMTTRHIISALVAGFLILLLQTYSAAQDNTETQDAVAAFSQGQDLHEKGDLAGALKLYEKAIKILPEFPEAEYQRGVAQLALGNTGEAERSFRRAVELRADWTLAMASLASLLIHDNRPGEAEDLLKRVIALEPQNPLALTALTDLRLAQTAPPDVLQDLLVRVTILTAKANPTASLWTARAALESALSKRVQAKSSLAKALAIDPKNRTALFQTADLAVAENDTVSAIEIARRLESLEGNSDALKRLRASIYAQEGKLDEAINQLNAMARPSPAATELRQRITAARAASPAELEKQLETDARNALILGRLCSMYRRDDPPKALDYCRRASESEPANINHAIGYGAALVQAKQFDAAVSLFRKLLEFAPDNSTAHANLATALFQLKRYAEARTEFLWLVSSQPGSAGPYFFLGIVHDQLNEYLDAMANYQQYLRLADPVANKLDIERVNLRLPALARLIKERKGKH